MTYQAVNAWLEMQAMTLSSHGWTVIGSEGKTPKLHPWKNSTKSQLLTWAMEDLRSGRANSLNLRLADSNLIALDCDFHDGVLMETFINGLTRILGLRREHLFTVVGSKGGKVFFRYAPQTESDKAPRRLGAVAYSAGNAGNANAKQELEVKSDLSTVAGIHSKVTRPTPDGRTFSDAIIYTSYQGTQSILNARPTDLQPLSRRTLDAIEDLYMSLLCKGGFVSEGDESIDQKTYQLTNMSALASYLLRIACRQKSGYDYGRFYYDAVNDQEFAKLVAPYYSYLNLDDAIGMVNRLFHDGPTMRIEYESQMHTLFSSLKAGNFRPLWEMIHNFERLTSKAAKRLRMAAQAKGLIQESKSMEPLELYAMLYLGGEQ